MSFSIGQASIEQIRADFPLLSREVNAQPLAYLDSAASAQKPQIVIDRELNFYRDGYAAVHRGIHTLSAEATAQMEAVRSQVAGFINAASAEEIVFVKGTTEAINLVANSYGRHALKAGDSIIITEMEHHANIVPWQMLAKDIGIEIRVWPLTATGELELTALAGLMDNTTKLLAITQVSNVLGTVNPIKEIVAQAKAAGLVVLVDGAQAIMHQAVDVQDLGCDFYVFSGHKLYGPSGIGILYGKSELLQQMPPWEGGGAMIKTVSLTQGTTFADAPWRFEAGSPNTAGIMGLGAAISYVNGLGLEQIQQYEQSLMQYALEQLSQIKSLTLYGPTKRAGVIAFNLGQHHAYDVGSFLDQYGIAIRTGHHCAMPLMAFYQVPSMCRASLALYNTREEVDRLVAGLLRIEKLLG
ncbi:bifunctional cysteine desulfurase/selenocysteine lyase [Yersinia enterocolitica]|uniref:cysteine desulfurase SufS n=1 Tax=Yersinia enterocolitica TaxID=630 RepID=UPI000281940C|nr:cysteine desulfurase SufS [Yersinia enterocolitica]AJI84007.1 cysteine desulfurase [Yersinia enterocolitica]EKA27942.1 bifunctional cysteine desulfurase/selenocysteine lyase [Yersinia enterocolitica subsp. enterocolitica WA-314]ELI8283301.1 cysteine desulfurase SufS [Yersinia enterocolitica]KGA70763.1 cysteine desulfurase [Yersinia enterocolitica]KGA75716.1 cysteine desulfurase [Yersinia enterocolitica]